jgi:hypothetical protein
MGGAAYGESPDGVDGQLVGLGVAHDCGWYMVMEGKRDIEGGGCKRISELGETNTEDDSETSPRAKLSEREIIRQGHLNNVWWGRSERESGDGVLPADQSPTLSCILAFFAMLPTDNLALCPLSASDYNALVSPLQPAQGISSVKETAWLLRVREQRDILSRGW